MGCEDLSKDQGAFGSWEPRARIKSQLVLSAGIKRAGIGEKLGSIDRLSRPASSGCLYVWPRLDMPEATCDMWRTELEPAAAF